jgi:large subunit ribosomal protein L28
LEKKADFCAAFEKRKNKMSQICQITGKHAMVGNNVSHSKRRTKRVFHPNLFTKRFFLEDENRWISLKVSAAGIRIISKNGLKAAIDEAKSKGFLKSR